MDNGKHVRISPYAYKLLVSIQKKIKASGKMITKGNVIEYALEVLNGKTEIEANSRKER